MVADDLDRAAEVLGLAFGDYAWTRWVVDGRDHLHRVTMLDRLFLQHFALPYGNACVTTVAGVIESVASWIDTAVTPNSTPPADIAEWFAVLEGDRHESIPRGRRGVPRVAARRATPLPRDDGHCAHTPEDGSRSTHLAGRPRPGRPRSAERIPGNLVATERRLLLRTRFRDRPSLVDRSRCRPRSLADEPSTT